MKTDYYQVLGITRDATDDQVKRAYRKLAMNYHPDRNPGNEQWANEKFKEINEAYGVLDDPPKRSQYDQFGTTGSIGDIFGSSFTTHTFEDLMKDFGGAGLRFDFLDDIFGEALRGRSFSFTSFGSGFGNHGAGFQQAFGINLEDLFRQNQEPEQQSVLYQITITKDQATRGIEKELVRSGKKLRVKIPSGIKNGEKVRLRNARNVTDGQQGDILIRVTVK